MKKLIFFFTLALSINAFSQIQKPILKGNVILGGDGSLSFRNSKTENYGIVSNDKSSSISINPSFLYFVIDHFAIGLKTSLSLGVSNDTKYYGYGIGPILKYYSSFGLLVKAESQYSSSVYKDSNSSSKNFIFKSGLGYAFFLNQKVSIEPCIGYEFGNGNSNAFNSDYKYSYNNTFIEIGFNIFL